MNRDAETSPGFGPAEEDEAERLIQSALAEDLPEGDVTTAALIPLKTRVRAAFVLREPGVVCGVPVAVKLFSALGERVACRPLLADGQEAQAGQAIFEVSGPARPILGGERIALNFLQHLSGIATRARRWVEALAGTDTALLDTRKTLPGWRRLEKYAVRAGGAGNHRLSLSHQALVKDNHARILRELSSGGPRAWVAAIRERYPGISVELEVESLEQFREAIDSGADIILLDNMSNEEMSRAAREIRSRPARPLLEASGGMSAGRLREVAVCGVDRISAGSLTHSAPALDIGLDLLEVFRDQEQS